MGVKGRHIVIAYDCDPAFVCTGPAPFDANETPCCDEHEEEWTRGKALEFVMQRSDESNVRHLANAIGTHYRDMVRFLRGEASLTYPAREKVREIVR